MTERRGTNYSLTLSEAEVQRYRMMAESAKQEESDLWQLAGITAGATVADVGCGPGALLPALSPDSSDLVAPCSWSTPMERRLEHVRPTRT